MNRMNSFLLVVAIAFGTLSLGAQDEFLKADKFYELYAFDLAISHYETALAKNENLAAMAKLADSYRQVNDLGKAAEWYKKIYAKPNKAAIDVFLYAQTLKSLGKYSEAKTLFQEYENNNPTIGSHYAASCDFAIRNKNNVSHFEVVPIAATNSKEADVAPAFLGGNLVFSSFRKDDLDERGTSDFKKSQSHQFYTSEINSKGQVSPSLVLRKGIHTSLNEAYARTCAAAKTVAYVKTNSNFANGILPLAGSGAKMDIYFAEMVNANSWDDVKAFPYNDGEYATGYPFLSPDGKELYFSSNRKGGYGGYDLYVSRKIGENWSEPKNLGGQINTPGNEVSPWRDGITLYFASDWHLGYGGLDVFKSDKDKDSWKAVKNLGPAVNSAANDYDFIYSSKYDLGFFVSNRAGGKGKDDIYKTKKVDIAETIQVVILDEESGAPVEGVILDLSECGYGIFKADEKGLVTIPAIVDQQCDAVLQKTGFKESRNPVSLSNNRLENITIKMSKMKTYYVGLIRNSETENAVANIKVSMTDENGKTSKVNTDEQGRYALALEPNMKYKISYSKAGYLNKEKTIATGRVIDHNLLAVVEVEPSPFAYDTVYATKTDDDRPMMPEHLVKDASGKGSISLPAPRRDHVEKSTPKKAAAAPEKSENPAPRQTEKPQAITKKTTEDATIYEIQIGAFSKPNIALQSALSDVGMVYTDKKGDLLLYKVGTFNTKNLASAALASVKKRGYNDAFVRLVKNDNPIVRAISNMSDKEKKETILKEETTKNVASKPKIYKDVVFKVQLGAYRSSSKVDFSPSLLKAGQLTTYTTEKGITVYQLGDFESITAAQSAKSIAVAEGVESAFVVAYKDGKKVSIQEATK